MEAFSLLKYWRGGGGVSTLDATLRSTGVTTIVTAVSSPVESDGGDDGPFFDLEFAVPDEDELEPDKPETGTTGTDEEEDSESDEDEFKFTLSTGTDRNVPVSPCDDLFFKGELVPVQTGTEPNPVSSQFSRLKSATNFRVLLLKLKKNKDEKTEVTKSEESKKSGESHSKFFTIKFNIEEIPIKSVFKRSISGTNKPEKTECTSGTGTGTDEKKSSKDVMQKYLKMVKPFYIRVSKRYQEKVNGGTSEPVPPEKSPAPENGKGQKGPAAGLRVVRKRLGKSRSAPAAAEGGGAAAEQGRRRDDSLLQQQDGIQGAILHCKRSFNASRDSELSILSRSVSDPSHDHNKSINNKSNKCSDEAKEGGL